MSHQDETSRLPGSKGRVAVTGVAGYLARRVADALHGDGWDVVGIDVRAPASPPAYEFRRADIGEPAFHEHLAGCDTVVHMAFALEQPRDRALARQINVKGSANVFAAAAKAGATSLIVSSSVSAYGPHPDNPPAMPESWPCRGHARSYYAQHKAEVEAVLDEFESSNAGIRVVRLRPYVVAGATLTNFVARMFMKPVVLGIIGHDPVFPLVHEDDLARAFVLAVTRDVHGAFNIGAPNPPRWSELAAWSGSKILKLPALVLEPGADLMFALHLQEYAHDWVILARGEMVMDLTKSERELGFAAQKSPKQAWMDFLRASKPRRYRALEQRGEV